MGATDGDATVERKGPMDKRKGWPGPAALHMWAKTNTLGFTNFSKSR
jgi:hypothetical protein